MGILRANLHVVDVQVVVGVEHRRLGIEGDAHITTHIFSQVDAHLFARGGVSDIIVDILRTRVVPFTQDAPSIAVVKSYQHDESVVGACGLGRRRVAAICSQGQVESEDIGCLNSVSRCDEPTLATCIPNLKIGVTIKHTVFRSKIPMRRFLATQFTAIYNIGQQSCLYFPTIRSKEFLIELFIDANHLFGPVPSHVVAFHILGAGPTEVGCVLGEVAGNQISGHGASIEGCEDDRIAHIAQTAIATVATHSRVIRR